MNSAKRQTVISLMLLSVLILSTAAIDASEDNSMFPTYSMTVEIADKAAWGALLECRKRGFSVAVAVVDRGGNLQALLRDRFAGPHTTETAVRKAWTANSFRQSTAVLAGLLVEKSIPSQVANNPGALLVGGGLVVTAGGETLGGIGVSGAPPGKSERDSIDGACAEAGIRSVQELLEFGK